MRDITTPDLEARRSRLRTEVEAVRNEFHTMVASISERDWTQPSWNAGWTNGQIVFHVLLGFVLVAPLARLLVLFDHLPDRCSRVLAGALNLSTPLFNRVNAIGPRGGASLLGRAGIIRQFDKVHADILVRIDRARPSDWAATMNYPTRWDPRFHERMDMFALMRYPIGHLRHHRQQLRMSDGR